MNRTNVEATMCTTRMLLIGCAVAMLACSSSSGDSGSGSDTGASTTDTGSGGGDTSTETLGDSADETSGDTPTEGGTCTPACTGAHMTCDPLDGKCKLDGTTTNVGAPCDHTGADPKCGTDTNATCNDQTNDGFPGGYCSLEPCSAAAGHLCPIAAACAHLNGESNACWKICSTDADCRTPDYGCFDVSPLYVSGASHKVCALKDFACSTDADCPAIKPHCTGASDAGLGTCG